MTKRKKSVAICLFILYATALLLILFFRRYPTYIGQIYGESVLARLQLIPFAGLVGATQAPLYSTVMVLANLGNLLGNCVLFLPLGVFLPLFFQGCRTGKRAFLVSLAACVALEAAQLFLLIGVFDVTVILMRLLGSFLGFSIWKAMHLQQVCSVVSHASKS